jgi:hypothetical protein
MLAEIVRQDKGGKNERWSLDLGDMVITLRAPSGEVVAKWTPVMAARGVGFPSFSRSIKYTTFNVADQGVYQFSMHPVVVRDLRMFADRGVASGGPAAARALRRRAMVTCAVGVGLVGLGLTMLAIYIYGLWHDGPG